MNRYTINIQGLVRVNPWVYSMEKRQRCRIYFLFFFFYNLRNAFLIKQKHRNDRVCLYFVSQKKLDSKTYFGYDFAEIFIFSKIENVYITKFASKTLDNPYRKLVANEKKKKRKHISTVKQ